MNTTVTKQVPPHAVSQEKPVAQVPDEQAEKLGFMIGLHPDGKFLSKIISEAKRAYKVTDQIAKTHALGLLSQYEKEKVIKITGKKGSETVVLTKLGKMKVSSYLGQLKRSNKEKFFAYVRAWMKKGDKSGTRIYSNSAIEVLLEYPEIACILMIPHYQNDIIDHYIRLMQLNKASSDNIDTSKVTEKIIRHLGLLVGIGFAKTKVDQSTSANSEAYYLTGEGRRIMQLIFSGSKYPSMSKSGSMDKKDRFCMYWISLVVSFIMCALIGVQIFGTANLTSLLSMIIAPFLFVIILLFMDYLIPVFKSLITRSKK